jgi:hypothetical protein
MLLVLGVYWNVARVNTVCPAVATWTSSYNCPCALTTGRVPVGPVKY